MMNDPESLKESLRHASLEEIIKERDRIIREIRKYEKGKIPEEDFCMNPSPDVVYYCNLSYLSEICDLIQEKMHEEQEKY